MAIEIERRFLVADDSWRECAESSERLVQGYILNSEEKCVRVRVAGESAWITVKGGSNALNRLEFEYSIPVDDARTMIDLLCDDRVIDKIRHRIPQGELTWEVDVFSGANEGLVIAEVELPTAETPFAHPAWLGEEVSQDPRYLNARLLRNPWPTWC
ncbi:MAG: CYTH domain-containing protein [Planctomycetales bacterium]|nr:CYTH domain-containing protein [Planctomycetales bacterium]